jgi:hypothetical protein
VSTSLELREALLHVPAFFPELQAAGKQAGTCESQSMGD